MARLLDTRRLTGRNFLLPVPGAAAEVAFDAGDDVPAIEAAIARKEPELLALYRQKHEAIVALTCACSQISPAGGMNLRGEHRFRRRRFSLDGMNRPSWSRRGPGPISPKHSLPPPVRTHLWCRG